LNVAHVAALNQAATERIRRRLALGRETVALALVALVFSCGSEGGGSVPSSGLSAEAYCSALAQQECAAFAGCCSLTLDDCRMKGVTSCLAAVSALPTYGMKFDGSTAQECLDATRTLYANCGYVQGMLPEYLTQAAACRALTVGTIAPGAACQYDDSCRSDSSSAAKCESSNGQKICVRKSVLRAGEDCQGSVGECPADAYCDTTCKPLKSNGDACDDNAECASSLCTGSCLVQGQADVCKKITG
jgi:hypothetical protein